jgi:hypothetical protein
VELQPSSEPLRRFQCLRFTGKLHLAQLAIQLSELLLQCREVAFAPLVACHHDPALLDIGVSAADFSHSVAQLGRGKLLVAQCGQQVSDLCKGRGYPAQPVHGLHLAQVLGTVKGRVHYKQGIHVPLCPEILDYLGKDSLVHLIAITHPQIQRHIPIAAGNHRQQELLEIGAMIPAVAVGDDDRLRFVFCLGGHPSTRSVPAINMGRCRVEVHCRS